MGFKKILLQFPAEGFAGETVKHTLTKTNFKNQPELSEKGLKEGDIIDIVKVEEATPLDGDSAATKKSTTTTKATKSTAAVTKDDTGEETGRGDRKRAKEIADAHSLDTVYENEKGEFYTTKNLVLLSVAQDRRKVITHTF